ncbi:hypothetical protein CCACVL1_02187, partial [Corchorus capsularis]
MAPTREQQPTAKKTEPIPMLK